MFTEQKIRPVMNTSPEDQRRPFVLSEHSEVAVGLFALGASLVVGVVAGNEAGWKVAGLIVGSAFIQTAGKSLWGGRS